jgi:isoleucyl-tRNA synthetase
MLSFVREVESKYQGKKILVISHGDPIWILMKYFNSDHAYPHYATPVEINVGITDLHRPYIDDVVLKCEKCGKDAHRIPAVMDVWFDSGAMPYAQWHYPFENKDMVDGPSGLESIKSALGLSVSHKQFPADYISEAIDQTRGWFYTLLAISTVLDRGPAYLNVINLGHLLDEKGQKMSKSKGNVVDPWAVIHAHGVDGLRWFMYSVNQPGDNKLFAVRDVELIIRKNFLTLWNVASFLTTYARFDNFEPQKENKSTDVLDLWIQAKTQALVNEVSANLDSFDVFHAAREIEQFINDLSTWYVRRSRDRKSPDVYQTLFDVLQTLAKLLAPFAPFFAENLWQALRQDDDAESVHLASWPEVQELESAQKDLLVQMDQARMIVEAGHALRKNFGFKVRQPLASLKYSQKDKLSDQIEQIVADELNVKRTEFEPVDNSKVEFDLNITPELKVEGLARELERTVQDMRKKQGLKVGESVNLSYDTEDAELIKAFELFDKKKTFVAEIKTDAESGEDLEIDGKKVAIKLERAS